MSNGALTVLLHFASLGKFFNTSFIDALLHKHKWEFEDLDEAYGGDRHAMILVATMESPRYGEMLGMFCAELVHEEAWDVIVNLGNIVKNSKVKGFDS